MRFSEKEENNIDDKRIEITLDVEVMGSNLKKFRKERGWTREDFADLIGVSSRIIADYEDGFKKPSLPTFYKISVILGVSMDDILRGA